MQSFLQGHGVEGRFGGLPDEYCFQESAAIAILPVPFDQTTTYAQGADLGPAALIEASRNLELYDVETETELFRVGMYTAEPISALASQEMLDETYRATLQMLQAGKFVAVIGGEHSISSAPIRAHAEYFGSITVLQIDAHADLVDAYEGNPLSHASVMARVREIEGVDRSVSVGIRSVSSDEKEAIERENTIFGHEIDLQGEWIERVLSRLGKRVYITFDLDAFDSSLMPATGTPEPGGLFWHQATALLQRVARERDIVGLDLVELCPIQGLNAPNFLAAKLLYKTLSYIFSQREMR